MTTPPITLTDQETQSLRASFARLSRPAFQPDGNPPVRVAVQGGPLDGLDCWVNEWEAGCPIHCFAVNRDPDGVVVVRHERTAPGVVSFTDIRRPSDYMGLSPSERAETTADRP